MCSFGMVVSAPFLIHCAVIYNVFGELNNWLIVVEVLAWNTLRFRLSTSNLVCITHC